MTKTLVVGLGQFGMNVLEAMHELGGEVAVLDKNREKIERVRSRCAMSAVVDASNLSALESLMPEGLQSVVIDCGGKENPFLNVLISDFYHHKMIPHIVALAYSKEHAKILRMVGATEVVEIEKEVAARVARSLARPDFDLFFPLSEEFCLAEVKPPAALRQKKVSQIDFLGQLGVLLVGLKSVYEGKVSYRFPSASDQINEESDLILFGPEKKISKLLALGS